MKDSFQEEKDDAACYVGQPKRPIAFSDADLNKNSQVEILLAEIKRKNKALKDIQKLCDASLHVSADYVLDTIEDVCKEALKGEENE